VVFVAKGGDNFCPTVPQELWLVQQNRATTNAILGRFAKIIAPVTNPVVVQMGESISNVNAMSGRSEGFTVPLPPCATTMAAHEVPSTEIESLRKELEEKSTKIEKLKKYILNVEMDGDRLNKELVIANSYRNCFDSITNPLFMVNTALEISYANKAFFEITGSSPAILQQQATCSDFLQCGRFREKCLLKECFEKKEPITGFQCKFVNSADRRFRLVVDALPIHNIATGEILGGIEVFREVVEDTTTKYLMFGLAGQEFGISTKNLREVISMVEITAMPDTPSYVRGLINLRSQVIPIIDMNRRLGFQQGNTSTGNLIIVLEAKTAGRPMVFGIIVDQVNEIRAINAHDVEQMPSVGAGASAVQNCKPYIAGVAKHNDRATILLKCDGLIDSWEHTDGDVVVR
jgi:purine-binding chemotaxis protein CheW